MKASTRICLFLLVVMIMLQGTSLAIPPDTTMSEQTAAAPVQPAEAMQEEPAITEEDEDKRGVFEKHFLREDGSYLAVSYAEPVHYEKDGQWFEIDNTLQEELDASGTTRLVNKDGLFNVSFSQRAEGRAITIEQEGYAVSFSMQAELAAEPEEPVESAADSSLLSVQQDLAKPEPTLLSPSSEATAKIVQHSDSIPTDEQKTAVPQIAAELMYEDVFEDAVDVEYEVLPSQVKENIILQEKTEIISYVFPVEVDGLAAVLNSDRTVTFYNQAGESIFFMPAPYMFDSVGAYSEEIDVTLEQTGDDAYALRITPDAEWLHDAARAYPITIDPTVVTNTNSNYVIDRTVKASGTYNQTDPYLYVGYPGGVQAWTYVRHTSMPSIPGDALIDSAKERFRRVNGTGKMDAFLVNTSWNSGSITWANKPTNLTTLATQIGNNGNYVDVDITEAAGKWYKDNTGGTNANYGIMLRYSSASSSGYHTLYSGDCGTSSYRPQVSIVYYPAITVGEGIYFIRNYVMIGNRTRFLNVADAAVVSQTEVQTIPMNGNLAQQWRVERQSNGLYKISSMLPATSGNQYTLSVQGGADANNANVVMWLNPNTQYFTFHQRNPNSIYIRSNHSRIRVLEMPTNSSYSDYGRDVKMFRVNNSAGMQWLFEPAGTVGNAVSPDYSVTDNSEVRCYPYAMYLPNVPLLYVKDYVEGYDVNTTANRVLAHFPEADQLHDRSVRKISKNDRISMYREFKIALRTYSIYRLGILQGGDYHFMIQCYDGSWANKAGECDSENLGFIDPDDGPWNYGGIDPYTGERIYGHAYDEGPIYFAVRMW